MERKGKTLSVTFFEDGKAHFAGPLNEKDICYKMIQFALGVVNNAPSEVVQIATPEQDEVAAIVKTRNPKA